MKHLKAIFSGMLFSLSVILPGAASGISEGTILLSGSVVNTACEVSVLTAEKPQDSQPSFEYRCLRNGEPASMQDNTAEGELAQGRLPQSMGRTSYSVLNEERGEAYLRVDYF
ncbi:type 1 fimbrial protein [Morganella morganii]|uniref:type 1 fimbrial protein n=1 Tax=Morganella morganii TaxID=582 RepID=UPI00069CB6B6|nr:type 1 fimbrial protein [Morganella morganii]EJD6037924.1 type 1 fimbrial protein [Morganella morganii]EKK5375632.1 type 1 fimbrial protein [Morganella morganii]EKK5570228.1 type 1 fimbrial protein [Morganella morganii]KNZ90200.1 hypothetical protein AKG16_00710 [Morganella morganii]MBS9543636.1 type 1 fimbrial protein [Morganella morganii subsp. morganii]